MRIDISEKEQKLLLANLEEELIVIQTNISRIATEPEFDASRMIKAVENWETINGFLEKLDGLFYPV